jgi:hypothetical protein
MPLILHGLTPIHWVVGGAGIALITLALLFVANRRLGISTGLEDVRSFGCRSTSRWTPSGSARKWRFHRWPRPRRVPLRGARRGLAPTWDLGRSTR